MAIIRPIGRPKVHARKRDPVEVLIEGDKLKKTFRVTCSKCGEKGHNYKTCKGAPANTNPRKSTRKKRRGETSTQTAPIDIQAEAASDSQHQPSVPIQPNVVPTSHPIEANLDGATKNFRAKQPIRRRPPKNLMPSTQQDIPTSNDATKHDPQQAPGSPMASPSIETLAPAESTAQRIWEFMPTLGLKIIRPKCSSGIYIFWIVWLLNISDAFGHLFVKL
ncbi:hypothetical protein PIB30_095747 [Stylosanthes scabra]|uniref:CCHC-type domain-containing protein n=1 Tax=Stylosanthes scabra TaxID=79078 RepID=A0ABU6YUR0_9FABA|nr:hypothetical protein [Stylosanthes scabra]